MAEPAGLNLLTPPQNLSADKRAKNTAEMAKFIHHGTPYLLHSASAQIAGTEKLLKGGSQPQNEELKVLFNRCTANLGKIKDFDLKAAVAQRQIEQLANEAQRAFKTGQYGTANQLADSADKALQALSKEATIICRSISQADRTEAALATKGVFVTDRFKAEEPSAVVKIIDSYLASSLKYPMAIVSKLIENPEKSIRIVRDVSLLALCAEPTGTGAGFSMGFTGDSIIEGVRRGKLDWELPVIYLLT